MPDTPSGTRRRTARRKRVSPTAVHAAETASPAAEVVPAAPAPVRIAAPAVPAAGEGDGGGMDLLDIREIIGFAWRYKILFIVFFLTGVTLAWMGVKQLTPRYVAEAVLTLNTRDLQVVEMDQVLPGLKPDMAVVQTEIDVIRSRFLAERVVNELELYRLPEFNSQLEKKPDRMERIKGMLGLGDGGKTERFDYDNFPPEEQQHQRAGSINALISGLRVHNNNTSYTIKIGFESTNKQLAALVADKVAETYVSQQVDEKSSVTRDASAWLDQRLTELRQRVRESEIAVQNYRAANQLVSRDNMTVTAQQLGELNTQLSMARADRLQAEARLRGVRNLVDSAELENGNADYSNVLTSPLMEKLREDEARIRREQAEMSTRYGDRHPAMIRIQAESRNIRAKMSVEARKILRGVENDVDVALAREQSLKTTLDELQGKVQEANSSQVRLRELEREADANREIFQNFLERFKETEEQQDLARPDARIISRAEYSTRQSYPDSKRMVAVGGIFALLISVGLALFRELMERGFRQAARLENVTGLPVLGSMIHLRKKKDRPERHVLKYPLSPFTESVRSVYTALQYTRPDHPPQVVLVASSLPGEGKTSFCISLARTLASGGMRVLLIDCDLRKARVSSRVGKRNIAGGSRVGLCEVLEGKATIREALRMDKASGMHFLAPVKLPANPQDLLASRAMQNLVDKAARKYDLVLLDAPALLPVADSLILSDLAESVLFLVRWRETRRDHVQLALRQLRRAGVPVAGTLMTRVNAGRFARYGQGDYGAYFAAYSAYGDGRG